MRIRANFELLARGASVLAIGAAMAATPTLAQDVEDEEEVPPATGTAETAESEIVVTGIRASLANAAQIKRDAEQIVDSITAQDIGALPDRSVSEALQRIPGITLQRTNEARDPARLAAEGGGIFIRGLSWVRSEVNGRDIFSANNGRAISFEDISADLLAGIDVYKNPSADMIEGSIGGLINLRTRKPLDQDQLIAVSGDFNYADLRDEGYWSGNALYSNHWDTGAGEFGVLVSGSIGNIGNRTDSIQTGLFSQRTLGEEQDGLPAGSTVYVPDTLGFRRIDWEQRRVTLDGVVQYRPVPELTITAEAIYTQATPEDLERNVGDYASPLPTDHDSYVFDERNVLQSGSVAGRQIDNNTRYGYRRSEVQDYSLNLEFRPGDHWTFTADVQRIITSTDIDSFTVFVANASNPPIDAPNSGTSFDVDFDLSGEGGVPRLHYTPVPGPLGRENYWWAAAMDHFENNEADQWAYRADAEYDFLDDGFLRSFRVGVRATDRSALSRQTGWNWGILSCQHWGCAGPPVYLDGQGSPANPGLPDQAAPYDFENFFRGGVEAPGTFWFPTEELVSNGTESAFQYLQSTLTGGWGWMPIPEGGYDPNGGINDQSEETLAGYALLRFGMEDGALGRFDGNIGVRVVRTETDAALTGIMLNAPQTAVTVQQCEANAATAGEPASICDPLAATYRFFDGDFSGGVSQDVTFDPSNSYTNVLPTLNLRFHLRDDLQLRLAAGRAVVRPSFLQLNPFSSLSFNFDSNGFPTGIGPFTGNGASPNLKPIKATQFDASFEYYFGQGGMLSVAGFYKRISDYIFASQQTRSFTANGETIDFDLTTLTNGEKGSIKGFEIGYQQFYDFLPGALGGLGLQANYTFVDSSGGRNTAINVLDPNQAAGSSDLTLPLEGLSKHSFNVALMYEKYGISARLAYNWREQYLLTTSAANINRPVWFDDYGQLDGSILYSVTPNVKVGVQGTNLLASTSALLVGGADLHPRYSWTRTDRRIAFLVRTQF